MTDSKMSFEKYLPAKQQSAVSVNARGYFMFNAGAVRALGLADHSRVTFYRDVANQAIGFKFGDDAEESLALSHSARGYFVVNRPLVRAVGLEGQTQVYQLHQDADSGLWYILLTEGRPARGRKPTREG